VIDFVQGIDANSCPRIYICEFDEEILTFCQAKSRRLLTFFLSSFVDIDDRLQKLVLFRRFRKLLNQRVQYFFRISTIFFRSITVEVRETARSRIRKEKIDDP